MNISDITPAIQVKNEEYWIEFVLKDVLETFPEVILLDTGSTDNTKRIAAETANRINKGHLRLISEDYGNDANKIGNGRNVLRSLVQTRWMFLIDGDELWTKPQLEKLLAAEIPEGIRVVMAGSHNIEDVNGKLMKRTHDTANKDILMAGDVVWTRRDYPFEGYGLSNTVPMSLVHYLPAHEVFCYHMRHTLRSGKNGEAFFRNEKYGYFPYDKGHEPFDLSLLGEHVTHNVYL